MREVSGAEIPSDLLDEKVDEWKHADCRGAATLADAAIKALQYELASRGVKEGAEVVSEDLRSLHLIESVLETRTVQRRGGVCESRRFALPEQLRETMPKGRGFRMGELQIIFEPTEGPPHGHLSVSHPTRYPTYEELSHAALAPRRTSAEPLDVAAQA